MNSFDGAIALAGSALAVPFLAAAARAQGPPPSPVLVDPAVLQEVQDMRRVTGEIRAARRSLVATREPGLVLEIEVREGERVEPGQVLARLDSVRLDLELLILNARERLGEAVLAERLAAAARARRDFEILEGLAQRDAVNPKELADATSRAAEEEARLEQARQEIAVLEATRELFEQRVADMQPKATFAGIVVERRADAGEWLDVGDPLVELVSADDLEAWLSVPQAYYRAVVGSAEPPWIELDAAREPLPVESWRAVPLVNPEGRTFPLILRLSPGAALAPGMSVTATVPIGARAEHLTVQRDGILRGEAGPYVYVAEPGPEGVPHTASLRPVEVLFYAGNRAAVRAPRLAPGELVVVEGNERLFPSAPLLPREDPR